MFPSLFLKGKAGLSRHSTLNLGEGGGGEAYIWVRVGAWLMAVGCVLLSSGSLWWLSFCLRAYALDYFEEES